MTTRTHRLAINLTFPEGISPGEGRYANLLGVARMGSGQTAQAVLRGSALAGVLRHEWEKHHGDASKWFGEPLEENNYKASPLRVQDTPLLHGDSEQNLRTHIAVNRHTGAVLKHDLFSLESLPPGTHCKLCLWFYEETALEQPLDRAPKAFLSELLQYLNGNVTLGGHAARGLGRVALSGATRYKVFDLADRNQRQEWMDEEYAWRKDRIFPTTGETLGTVAQQKENHFQLDLTLAVPGAEDLLIADGQGLDFEMEPQKVKSADGKAYFRIPGSSLRGVFRQWFNRLAARAGHPVSDPVANASNPDLSGNTLAWLGKNKEQRECLVEQIEKVEGEGYEAVRRVLHDKIPPVDSLFGSAFAKGRIHISDALAPLDPNKIQPRMHVAIDRFTGGANDGALFDNQVLVSGPVFPFRIRIESPTEQEIRWLVSALRALDTGVLRVGSSKAGGRLGVKRLQSTGNLANFFEQVWKETEDES